MVDSNGGQVTVRSGEPHQAVALYHASDRESIDAVVTATAQPVGRAYVRVEAGDRVARFAFEVDVGSGVQVPVCGERISVYAGADESPEAIEQRVRASIGFYCGEVTAPLTRTRYADRLSPGVGKGGIDIPAFAKTMRLECDELVEIELFDARHVLIPVWDSTPARGTITLPPDALSVHVRNVGLAVADVRLVFGLDLLTRGRVIPCPHCGSTSTVQCACRGAVVGRPT